jgi:hypothetical protein
MGTTGLGGETEQRPENWLQTTQRAWNTDGLEHKRNTAQVIEHRNLGSPQPGKTETEHGAWVEDRPGAQAVPEPA